MAVDTDQFEALETAERLIASAIGLLLHHYGDRNAVVIATQLVEDYVRSETVRQERRLASCERRH